MKNKEETDKLYAKIIARMNARMTAKKKKDEEESKDRLNKALLIAGITIGGVILLSILFFVSLKLDKKTSTSEKINEVADISNKIMLLLK